MVSREQQKEIAAFALLALSVFLLLTLVPVGLFGERAAAWFPSGNAMGPIGGLIHDVVVTGVGAGAIVLPFLLFASGLALGGWLDRVRVLRFTILSAALLILLPATLHVFGAGPTWTGLLGGGLGTPLLGGLGWLGSILLLLVVYVALAIGVFGWSPVRGAGKGLSKGKSALSSGLNASAEWLGEWKLRRGRDELPPDLEDESEPLEATPADPDPVDEVAEADDPPTKKRPKRKKKPVQEEMPDPLGSYDSDALPSLDLLTMPSGQDRQNMVRELDRLGEVLVEKLRTFNVECEIGGRTTGPVVTQFEVVPAAGVKVNRIANLDADLALAMKAKSIRIVAPIPGKGAVGVEIPNPEPAIVQLREILESPAYQSPRLILPLALGRDLTGEPYVADLARMPHALIAGATGSGKSVCINTIITSLIYRHTPETLRLLMVDPKMVELSAYGDLPHLRHPVVTDPRDAAGVLKWAVIEMERRYALLSANGVRSIAEFNKRVRDEVPLRRVDADGEEGDPDRWLYTDGSLPYIVVLIDELADLMMTVQGDVEKPLTLLAQKARAIGIHLIVATQRPSVNVITGLIKANFPCRIGFRVASKTDSRTILDQNGADALLGNGDMLFLPPGSSEPMRVQGAYISTEDTDKVMRWFREETERRAAEIEEEARVREVDILDEVRSHEQEEAAADLLSPDGPQDWDELFRAAAEVCLQNQQGSTSLLQRKLKIGYGRAARIVDQLEIAGILSGQDGSKPREILVSYSELDEICGAG